MNFFQLLFLIVAPLLFGTLGMNPTRKGNENFSENHSTIVDEDVIVDSEYPGFNVHYNFEPKDWRAIELNEEANFEFTKEINEEIKRMNNDKMKMIYILNIQKEQIRELLYFIKVIQSNKKTTNNTNIQSIPQYLRSGSMENTELTQKKIQDSFDHLHHYSIVKNKYNKGSDFYYGLMDQWAQ